MNGLEWLNIQFRNIEYINLNKKTYNPTGMHQSSPLQRYLHQHTQHQSKIQNNYFRDNLESSPQTKAAKKEKKIKIFGISDKNKKKTQSQSIQSPFTVQQSEQQPKKECQKCDQILIQSNHYIPSIQNSIQKSPIQNYANQEDQLQKLLDISSEKSLQQLEIPIQNNGNQQNAVNFEKQKLLRFQNGESLERNHQIIRATQSQFILSQQKQENQLKSPKLIEDLHLIECSQQSVLRQSSLKQSFIQHIINSNRLRQQESFKQPKLKSLKDQMVQTSIVVYKEQKTTNKNPTQLIISPQKHKIVERPFIPLPRKQKKESPTKTIKTYLGVREDYQMEVNKLIDRYEQVTQLKQKNQQIKTALSSLTRKKHQSQPTQTDCISREDQGLRMQKLQDEVIQRMNHPHKRHNYEHELQQQQIERNKQIKKCEYFERKSTVKTNSFNKNDVQLQLSKNVENMEKIISKFKEISQNISADNYQLQPSQYGSALLKTEGNFNRFFTKKQYNKKQTDNIQQFSNIPLSTFNQREQSYTQILNQKDTTKHILLNDQEQFIDSINYTNNQYINNSANDDKITSVKLMKNVAKTQKKSSTLEVSPKNYMHTQYNEPKSIQCNHQDLMKQINRLHTKIQQIEKQQKEKDKISLRTYKSLESNKTQGKVQPSKIQLDKNSIEDEFYNGDNSIPNQKAQKAESIEEINNKITKRNNQQKEINKKLPSILKNEVATISQNHWTSLGRQSKKQLPPKHKYPRKSPTSKPNRPSKRSILQSDYKMMQIQFPHFHIKPERNTPERQLIKIGSEMYRTLFIFATSQQKLRGYHLSEKINFKIKKYVDCVHFYASNQLNYHLLYYYKGKIYFGEWKTLNKNDDGFKQGWGSYFHPKKYIYLGNFDFDKKHGKGLINYTNGDIYQGNWINGKKEGQGTLINAMGDIFKGYFKNGKKNGVGEQQLNNGDFYKGQFKDGKLEGQGIYWWQDGAVYRGSFKNGLLHGKGIWRSKENDVYEGQYRQNKKHGLGTYKWSNGVVFTGNFCQDERTTRGIIPVTSQISQATKRNSANINPSKQRSNSKKKYSSQKKLYK